MNTFRWLVPMLGLAFLFAGVAGAEEKGKRPAVRRVQVKNRTLTQLLPYGVLNRLDLSKEQKAKLEELSKEYNEKLETIRKPYLEAVENARKQGGRVDRKVTQKYFQNVSGLRKEYQAKARKLLTKEQQKKIARPFPIRPVLGIRGNLFNPYVQRRLELTKEQQEKLAKIQKEMEEKAKAILTDEQKKKYEQMKKPIRRIRPGVRPVPLKRKAIPANPNGNK